jgi:hypothetical protein
MFLSFQASSGNIAESGVKQQKSIITLLPFFIEMLQYDWL